MAGMGVADAIAKIKKIPAAVSSALSLEVAQEVKDTMKEAAMRDVYSYAPVTLVSRRMENGGLIDEANMIESVSGMTLTVDNVTPLQNLYGGDDTNLLAPIVEQGVAAYHMPGPRPFMDDTENMMGAGRSVKAIADGLRRQGYDVQIVGE